VVIERGGGIEGYIGRLVDGCSQATKRFAT
jgi:hypothetical protein